MTDERWRRIEEIFHDAAERAPAERAVFVREACAGDVAMCVEVESLLANQSRADALGSGLGIRDLGLDLIGKQIGVYQIVSLLGAGGMGEVYRARDMKLLRDVAIKALPAAFTFDPDRRARIEREARMLASFNHPNIGGIHGLIEQGEVLYLVLELVEGSTLAERLARSPLPIAEVVRYARQIVDALDAAHQKGIIHRDLKPANIKITPDGTLKILDFGLARAIAPSRSVDTGDAATLFTGPGAILGTPSYMSPEQARGDAVDKRTDIWSFGCVIYEMLTGTPVFGGRTTSDRIAATLEREPDWNALPDDTPASLRRLLQRCLEKSPRRRTRDIGDIFLELEDLGTGVPVAALTEQTTVRADRFAWPFAVAFLAALALGIAVARPLWTDPRRAPEFSRVIQLGDGQASESGPAISPDGKWIAYLSDVRGPTDVWVRFLGGSDPMNLTASTTLEIQNRVDLGGLAIKPDGSSIAFDAGATKGTPAPLFDAWVVPAPGGGTPRKIVQLGRAVRWSPDGTRILFIRPGSGAGDALFTASSDGGSPKELVALRGGIHIHWPVWSHDGRYIYFNYSISTANREPAEIYRVPAAGGPIEPVVTTTRRAVFPLPTPDGAGLIYAANPTGVDLALWWRPLDRHEPTRLTTGVGEYAEPSVTSDGKTMISALVRSRQTLTAFPISSAPASPRQITDGSTGDFDPALSPGGNQLVFSSSRSGFRNLWTARPDGTMARPLTSGNAFDERPAFSPDGQRLAFVSDRGGEPGIWIMSADGGIPEQLIKVRVIDRLVWSANGRRVVYATSVNDLPVLRSVSAADGTIQQIRTPGPALNPFSMANDTVGYVEPLPGGSATPNLTRVAFVRISGEPIPAEALRSLNLANGFAVISPDGRRLAAVVDPGGATGAIWVADLASGTPFHKVTDLPSDVRPRGATWTHDSNALIVGTIQRTSHLVLFDQAK